MSPNAGISSSSPRRFIARPFETSSRNSKGYQSTLIPADTEIPSQTGQMAGPGSDLSNDLGSGAGPLAIDSQNHQYTPKPRSRRPLPEPIETTKTSNRLVQSESRSFPSAEDILLQAGPRKFEPQLIETAKRSFRKKDASHSPHRAYLSKSAPSESTLLNAHQNSAQPMDSKPHGAVESRFSYASLLKRQETRRHSFRVPDLPVIPSDSSEGSDGSELPSLSTSPSGSSGACTKPSIPSDRRRESCDEKVSEYLLSLAARSAERQLKDQALAAFPNEQVYQPVDHFAIDREDESSNDEELITYMADQGPSTYRRASSADLSWELEYMRQHKEEAVMRNRVMAETNQSRFSSAAIAARFGICGAERSEGFGEEWHGNNGNALTRNSASPPMLGTDLVFPQSLSPEATFCESNNGNTHCQQSRYQLPIYCGGLWTGNARHDHNTGNGGLWMGTCGKVEFDCQSRESLLAGMVTPAHDIGEPPIPLDNTVTKKDIDKSPNSLNHDSYVGGGSRDNLGDEFHDGVVTQIYNYLSLGYPCVARYYDYELSKISGITVEELRRDDLNTDAKGYVGVSESNAPDCGCICTRWSALRLYVQEWVRQQPKMADDDDNCEAWGVRERRGSWAI